MPVHLHRSNRSERLVEALARVLATPPADPFAADAVVVHGRGLERWLEHELARRLGICADVRFPFPDDLLDAVRAAALGPDACGWSHPRVVGALMDLLPEAGDPVRAWLADQPGDRGRVELAHAVTALFDRYATYRPELAWDDDGWQAALWQALRERLGPDPATTALALERRLQEPVDLGAVPARVAFFSVGTLPPLTVRLIGALGRHREVHLFVLSPTASSWDHPLLASCGVLARDFQSAVDALAPPTTATFEAPGADTLLHALQSDLLHDRSTRHPADDSVRVHACAGPVRQVEVLRDDLLYLLDTVPGLEPRDILVMTPDIERWASLVAATFGEGADDWHRRADHPSGLPRIPFRVADRGPRRENAVAAALLRIVELAASRLRASELVDVATLPAVQRRFGLQPEDLGRFRELLAASAVRWGRDGAHRAAEDLPADDGYTWRFGLDRLLLGQAMSGEDTALGRVPCGDVEGKDDRVRLGRWIDLAETLLAETADLAAPRAPAAWRQRLLLLLDRCLDDPERWQAHQVRLALAELDALGERPLDRDGVLAWLEHRLGRSEPGAGFLAGAVTFSRLVPMRSIPFRVVVLLGMDDGTFPRLGGGLASDRIAEHPRPGDRTARDDDRALFLESLLSARDHLVVLYTGRDPQDGRPRPPCVPVAELLDVLDEMGAHRDALVRHHPLVPWSPRYLGEGPLFTHDRRQIAHAAARAAGPTSRAPFLPEPFPPVDPPAELSLPELQRFFKAPIQALLRARLGLWLPDDDPALEDRDPLSLGAGLEAWGVRDALLARALAGADLAEGGLSWQAVRAGGRLPLGMPGDEALRSAARDVQAILDAADLREPLALTDVEVDLDGTLLYGRVPRRGDRLVTVTASRAGGARRFACWLGHLLANASGLPIGSRLHDGRGETVTFRALAADEARAALRDLLAVHALGQRYPLLWFPDSAWTFARSGPDKVADGWGRWGEPDRHARLVLGGACPYGADLDGVAVPEGGQAGELALRLWTPALAAMEGT